MAGPQTISRLPTGLLDLLGMKGTGDTPHELAAYLQSNVDLTDLYLSDRVSFLLGSPTITGVGFVGGSPVPDGQVWLVQGLSLQSNPVTAGASVTISLAHYIARLNTAFILHPQQNTYAAGTILGMGLRFDRPAIWRPGDTARVITSAATGAPNFQVYLSIYGAALSL